MTRFFQHLVKTVWTFKGDLIRKNLHGQTKSYNHFLKWQKIIIQKYNMDVLIEIGTARENLSILNVEKNV